MQRRVVLMGLLMALCSPALSAGQKAQKAEIPFDAALTGWRDSGRHYLFLVPEDIPHDRATQVPGSLKTEDAQQGYFDTAHKQVVWATPGMNVIVLDTHAVRGYARVLLIEAGDAGKIAWMERRFVHRSAKTLTGQPNTDAANGAAKLIAYDAKDRRIYSVTYAESHGMHDRGGDLLVPVPMSLLPAEARLSRAMNGKLD